jgi:hypothetical protein
MDKGYDTRTAYEACGERDVLPVIPLRETPAVKRGEHKPPCCEHGEWRFAGADKKRGATKWRCPTGECKPASVWVKADRLHPLIPRETLRWRKLYRRRASVERRSDGSRTNGDSRRCECAGSNACGCHEPDRARAVGDRA